MIFTPYLKKFGNIATKNSIVLPDYFTENHVNAAKKLEGFRTMPYLDRPDDPQKAKLTIGYGHNLDDPAMRKSFLQAMPSWTNEMIDDAGKLLRSGKKLNPDWTISEEDADRLLRVRILQAHQELSNSRLKFETYPNNVKQGAVRMHLNLGMPRLLGFKKHGIMRIRETIRLQRGK
jgi:GH24 family phage-related lysozyme (muramidase)